MTEVVEIKGMDELRTILELPYQLRSRLVRTALRRASKPIQDEAVSLAPKRKGTTKKAIVILNETRADEPMVIIGPTKGRRAKYDAWYSRFQEFGTKGFGRRRRSIVSISTDLSALQKGKVYKKYKTVAYNRKGSGLPAIRFMQRAFESKKEQTLGNINKELSNVVVKYLRDHAPKYYAG